jgi:hypothetical protein
MSVCMYQLGSHGRIFVKYDIGDFSEICLEFRNLLTAGQKHRIRYVKTELLFTSSGDIKWPQNSSLQVKWYQAVRRAEEE